MTEIDNSAEQVYHRENQSLGPVANLYEAIILSLSTIVKQETRKHSQDIEILGQIIEQSLDGGEGLVFIIDLDQILNAYVTQQLALTLLNYELENLKKLRQKCPKARFFILTSRRADFDHDGGVWLKQLQQTFIIEGAPAPVLRLGRDGYDNIGLQQTAILTDAAKEGLMRFVEWIVRDPNRDYHPKGYGRVPYALEVIAKIAKKIIVIEDDAMKEPVMEIESGSELDVIHVEVRKPNFYKEGYSIETVIAFGKLLMKLAEILAGNLVQRRAIKPNY